MNRALLWREWQEMASPVTWVFAGLVLLGVVTRFVDDVIGVSICGIGIAIVIGNAATGSDRPSRIREFLLTRPVSRRRFLGMKLALAFGTLNAFVFALGLLVWLDLPARFFHLFAETALGERMFYTDIPVFYPAAILYANLILSLVMYARVFGRNPSMGFITAVIVTLVTGLSLQRLFSTWPDQLVPIALSLAVLFLVVTGVLVQILRSRFDVLEVTGGGV